jgi:PIN domain nuclease of toxin-antitoxin system
MMRLLLDTQIVYWIYYETGGLAQRARQLMMQADSIHVSSVSIWEIAVKARLGRIQADPQLLVEKIRGSGFLELAVLYAHVLEVANLPMHHADPFDRLLVAQAVRENLSLLTTDARLPQYSSLVIQV